MKASVFALGALALALAACGSDAGVAGTSGEWIQGSALSVRVTGTGMGGTMEVKNESDRDASFAPLKITIGDQVVADLDAADAGDSTLEPGDSFTFPIMTAGEMETVRIEMGSGAQREVFTVSMEGS